MTRRVLALAAALLGLLVMHGVGVHSAHAAEVHANPGHDASAAHGSAHEASESAPIDPSAVTRECTNGCATDSAAPLPRELSESLMALCLVVLLAVAGLLLLTGPAWRLSLLQPSSRLGPVGPPTSVRARPPDLHALSVLRC